MGKVYVHQTALIIQLVTGIDLSCAKEVYIRYKKNTGETGEWVAEVFEPLTGIIQYKIKNRDDVDVANGWHFWARIVFEDDTEAPGEPAQYTFYEEIAIEGTESPSASPSTEPI